MIRRYGEPVLNDRRYIHRPGVYVILPRDGRLLVTFQSEPEPEVQLPGGGIDAGEHPMAALHREVLEETGWVIGNARRLTAYRRFCYMPDYDKWAEKVCIIYLARPIRQLSDPSEPHHTAIWLRPSEAIEMVGSDGDRAALQGLF